VLWRSFPSAHFISPYREDRLNSYQTSLFHKVCKTTNLVDVATASLPWAKIKCPLVWCLFSATSEFANHRNVIWHWNLYRAWKNIHRCQELCENELLEILTHFDLDVTEDPREISVIPSLAVDKYNGIIVSAASNCLISTAHLRFKSIQVPPALATQKYQKQQTA